MDEEHLLTSRQFELLEKFYEEGKTIEVRTVKKSQDEIASELGITRQALATHLRTLKVLGFIRTGFGFIDLTEKALKLLGEKGEVLGEVASLDGVRETRTHIILETL